MKLKRNTGITLIALVITIIVMLILAGVSIATLTGDNGVLTQASKAKIEECHGTVIDGVLLEYGDYKIVVETEEENKEKTFTEYLSGKGIINADGVVSTEKLIGKKLAFGKESGEVDVYQIKKEETSYKLYYYDAEKTEFELKVIPIKEVAEEEIYIEFVDDTYNEGEIDIDLADESNITIEVTTNSKEDLIWTSSDESVATVSVSGNKNTIGNIELKRTASPVTITIKSGNCIKEIDLYIEDSGGLPIIPM